MDYIILALLVAVTFALYFRTRSRSTTHHQIHFSRTQRRKDILLEYLKHRGKITNNEVEDLLDVSDATATRYLQQLEDEGKIKQVGSAGKGVFYTYR